MHGVFQTNVTDFSVEVLGLNAYLYYQGAVNNPFRQSTILSILQ